jgi:peptidyl-prolyl cis-trans isomerase B (cyclophilin B)
MGLALLLAGLLGALGATRAGAEEDRLAGLAKDLPRVRLTTDKGNVDIVLLEDAAPNTVANFIELAEKKFYDGLTFHRVLPNFMIQGGDPTGTGRGGPGYRFADEVCAEAVGLTEPAKQALEQAGYVFVPGLKSCRVVKGALAMANAGPNTNGSQFFICHKDCDWLNGKHTVFGLVTQGQDVVDKMAQGDKIVKVEILSKRDHPYAVKKLGGER